MGGLKEHMPITALDLPHRLLAIAGFPWAAASTRRTRSSGRRSPPSTSRSSARRRLARPGHLLRRHHRGHRHQLLHVPQLLHDLHRRSTAAAPATATSTARTRTPRRRRRTTPIRARSPRRALRRRSRWATSTPPTAPPRTIGHSAADHGRTRRPHAARVALDDHLVLAALASAAVLASLLGIPWPGPATSRSSSAGSRRRCTAEVSFAAAARTPWSTCSRSSACGRRGGRLVRRACCSTRTPRAPSRRGSRSARSAPGRSSTTSTTSTSSTTATSSSAASLAFARAMSWFDGRILDGIVNAVGAIGRCVAHIDGAIDKLRRRRRGERGGRR